MGRVPALEISGCFLPAVRRSKPVLRLAGWLAGAGKFDSKYCFSKEDLYSLYNILVAKLSLRYRVKSKFLTAAIDNSAELITCILSYGKHCEYRSLCLGDRQVINGDRPIKKEQLFKEFNGTFFSPCGC